MFEVHHNGTASLKEYSPLGRRERPLLLIFIIACISLDISFGVTELKVGNLLLSGGCLLASFLALRNGYGIRLHRKCDAADFTFLAYVALVGVSAAWSPSAIDSIAQVFFFTSMWIAVYALRTATMKGFLRAIIDVAFLVAVLSLLLAIVSPEVAYQPSPSGDIRELRGVFHHQLRLGVFMALAVGVLILIGINGERQSVGISKYGYWVILFILMLTTVLAFARLYTLFVIVSLAVTLGVSTSGWKRWVTMISIVAATTFIVTNNVEILGHLEDDGFDVTLTGRVTIWEKTLDAASDAPVLGRGFPSFDHTSYDFMWGIYRPAHAHNSFIQAYFELGYLGFALVLLMAFVHFWKALGTWTVRRYSYSVFLVLLAILGSLTGSNYGGKVSSLFAIMLMTLSIEINQARLVSRRRW